MSIEDEFEGMNEALNVEYDNPDDQGFNAPVVIDEDTLVTTDEIDDDVDSRFLSKEDEKYITRELKKNVETLDSAMDTLNSDLGAGQSSKMFEAISLIGNAKTSALKELRALKTMRKTTEQESKKIRIQEKKANIAERKLEGDLGGDEEEETDGKKILISPQQMASVMSEARKIVEARNKEEAPTVVPIEVVEEVKVEEVKSTTEETPDEKGNIEDKFKIG